MLGAIRNATITAYDNAGNALSAATEVVNGKYALVLILDFKLTEDTVKLFTRNANQEMDFRAITTETLSQFAPKDGQSAFNGGTKMVINLDGTTTGSKYTLYLPTVPFNYEANTKTIFGIL
ncbi:hypothetical protein [Herbaspirillum seropedicae]|uniref:hypothetical protein n=1 Tax=Herbaspirillum seropedicae TaxID=964 RepID=UPI003D99C2E8